MYNKNPKEMVFLRLWVETLRKARASLIKRRGFNAAVPGIWFSKYLVVAVFITFTTIPVNGGATPKYQLSYESEIIFIPGLSKGVFQDFQKLSAAEYGVLLLLGFATGFVLGYFIWRRRYGRRLKQAKEEWEAEQSLVWKRLLSSTLKSAANQNKTGGQNARTLEKESSYNTAIPVSEKKPQTATWFNENSPDAAPAVMEWGRNDIQEKPPNQEPIETIYFANPNNEGEFRKADGHSSYIEGTSVYKFELFSDAEARFEFCSEQSSITMALNNRPSLILPVADEVDTYNPKAKPSKIVRCEYGKASLEGNIWKVTTKAKISYVQ